MTALFDSIPLVFIICVLIGLGWLGLGAIVGGDHGGDTDGHDHGVISTQVIALFLATFGAFGGLLTIYEAKPLWASLGGVGAGIPICAIWILMMRAFHKQEANSLPESETLIGLTATTVGQIDSGGVGEIRYNLLGNLTTRLARTAGPAIAPNTPVRVTAFDGVTVTVEPISPSN
ncbi:MAG: NfeD family protein [Verrucomicrobiota bacterium]|nr:NfeD family protein [Verrucomicrobiota bacterium]